MERIFPLERTVDEQIRGFVLEFVRAPYLCYGDHSMLAEVYRRVMDAVPKRKRTFLWDGYEVNKVQKAYPTGTARLWDVCVLRPDEQRSLDSMEVSIGIEVGLEKELWELEELLNDIMAVDVDRLYVMHLVREEADPDLLESVSDIVRDSGIDSGAQVLLGMSGESGERGAWVIDGSGRSKVI